MRLLGGPAVAAAVAARGRRAGSTSHDVSAAFAAGLTTRPIAETATRHPRLAALDEDADAPPHRPDRAEEQDLARRHWVDDLRRRARVATGDSELAARQ